MKKVDDELLTIQSTTPNRYKYTNDEENKTALETLPEPVLRNIETIIQLETDHGKTIPIHHRLLESVAAGFSQPRFLYSQIIFFLAWWLCSHLSSQGILAKDFPKFNPRADGLSVASLLISTGVLVYQNRQEKLAEERSHLTLQINLLTEQKIVKLIALVEELRTDLPNVRNRQDPEAEEMQQPIDPEALLTALKESLNPSDDTESPSPEAPDSTTSLEIQINQPTYLG
jgi:uncharacterized membrane protein